MSAASSLGLCFAPLPFQDGRSASGVSITASKCHQVCKQRPRPPSIPTFSGFEPFRSESQRQQRFPLPVGAGGGNVDGPGFLAVVWVELSVRPRRPSVEPCRGRRRFLSCAGRFPCCCGGVTGERRGHTGSDSGPMSAMAVGDEPDVQPPFLFSFFVVRGGMYVLIPPPEY